MNGDFVYLDYAATAAVRPPEVADTVAAYLRGVGATPGRSGHRLAVEAGRVALRCRQALARLFGVRGDAGRIAFFPNATHALNAALWGVLRPGDAVVVTDYDHNAVRRPVHRLARDRGIDVRRVPGRADGSIEPAVLRRALAGARLLVLNAASNVLGTTLPVDELSAMARAAGALVLVDAAQAAGHIDVDVEGQGIDLLGFTGHKGLLGPQGTGGLWVREGVDVEPLVSGGTGGDSRLPHMPLALPDRLEAGSLNGPGLAGLHAGVEWLLERGPRHLHGRLMALKAELREGLAEVPGVRVLSPPAPDGVPLVTLVAEAVDAPTLARHLDQEHGVLTRAGLHCAPGAHRVLGTADTGAVRFSLGWASSAEDVTRAVDAVGAVLRSAPRRPQAVAAGAGTTAGRDGPTPEPGPAATRP